MELIFQGLTAIEEGVSVTTDYSVDVRHVSGYLLVHFEARMSESDKDFDVGVPCFEAFHFGVDALHFIQKIDVFCLRYKL